MSLYLLVSVSPTPPPPPPRSQGGTICVRGGGGGLPITRTITWVKYWYDSPAIQGIRELSILHTSAAAFCFILYYFNQCKGEGVERKVMHFVTWVVAYLSESFVFFKTLLLFGIVLLDHPLPTNQMLHVVADKHSLRLHLPVRINLLKAHFLIFINSYVKCFHLFLEQIHASFF